MPPACAQPGPCRRRWGHRHRRGQAVKGAALPHISGCRMRRIILSALFSLVATLSWAAGIKFVQIPADANGPALKAIIWNPCAAAVQDLPIGPYVLTGRRDCPTVGHNLPLVVISHGHGGSFLNHHDLAETLADAGFVVAAINHPGDTFSDMSRAADVSVFVERPADIKRLIDYMLKEAPDAASIDGGKIGFFGFSRGGYTGLVLAGGNPDFLHANVPCPDPELPICVAIRRKEVPREPLTHDGRIKAYVLADPLDEFPTADSLKGVKAPIQLWASQFGGDGVLPQTMPALADSLPRRPDFHLVGGAAHFAFLAPCSKDLTRDAPDLCIDAEGFDRIAFHKEIDAKALAFFKSRLQE
ncbi:alpha/beta hydrolase family protein [Labrys monachus]|uniref:Dienelactone hydrolase n=1 Tax=Labrys monachus TaxID=217067 RepID=A0ABU0F7P8_9HYPH|nr:alpha/beta fold hydrolase [Labrys monachus]MDQ0390634.1 putative dienelactone hydrolase [Labrys monachus]